MSGPPAGRLRPGAAPRVRALVFLLDRVDAAALPAAFRAIEVVRAGIVGWTGREAHRVRRIGRRIRSQRSDPASDEPPALLEAVGVAPGGVVEQGVRVLVLGVVALIVVSATAALLQEVNHDQTAGTRPATGAPDPDPDPDPAAAVPAQPAVAAVTIGPGPHDAVPDYLGASRESLATLTAAAPEADLYAVVSLTAARTPADLLGVFGDFRTVQVFFTAGSGGAVEEATVRDPVADVQDALASAADQADMRAMDATQAGDPATADRARQAAGELRAGCSCLFAAVVRAPAGRLSELAADPRVRVVDPAPPGSAPPAVTFVPLAPDRH